jgi:gliding motility-associated-like protein
LSLPSDENGDNIYEIKIKASDELGNVSEKPISITIIDVDDEKPVITLNGLNPFILQIGDEYVDPGFSVYDNIDKDLADFVEITNEIDNSTLGQYEVRYNVNDRSGNVAETVTRDVIVSDQTPIKINGIDTFEIEENNSNDVIENYASNETIVEWYLTGSDKEFFELTDGDLLISESFDFENPVDSNKDNLYEFTINAIDTKGNIGVQSIQITVLDLDEIAPFVVAVVSDTSIATQKDDTTQLIYTFSEVITGLNKTDFEIENGELISLDVSDTSATLNIQSEFEYEGYTRVNLKASTFTDAKGNGNLSHRDSIKVDTKGPNMNLLIPNDSITGIMKEIIVYRNQLLRFKLEFNEDLVDFDNEDFLVDVGDIIRISAESSKVWSGLYYPPNDVEGYEGDATIIVPPLTLKDSLGNLNQKSRKISFKVDTKSPEEISESYAILEEGVITSKVIGSDFVVSKNLKYELNTKLDLNANREEEAKLNLGFKNDTIGVLFKEGKRVTKDTKNPGTLKFNSDGSFVFIPDENFYGDVLFQYFIVPDQIETDQEAVKYGPITVNVEIAEISDSDGIPTLIEELFPTNDIDGDGIPDRKADHIVAFPMTSAKEFEEAIEWATDGNSQLAPPKAESMGAIIVGEPKEDGAINPNNSVALLDIGIIEKPEIDPFESKSNWVNDPIKFSLKPKNGSSFVDLDNDPSNGTQVRLTVNLPQPTKGSSFMKIGADGNAFEFLDDQNLATYDEGATLVDEDNDGLIEKIIITLTDNGLGDNDKRVGFIDDPGALSAFKPVINNVEIGPFDENFITEEVLIDLFDFETNTDFDRDSQKISYAIADINPKEFSDTFEINSFTGELTSISNEVWDFERYVNENGLSSFEVIIKAEDSEGNVDLGKVIVQLDNLNEPPYFIDNSGYRFDENLPVQNVAVDLETQFDYNDSVTFGLIDTLDSEFVEIIPETGEIFFKESPDYEEKSVYELKVSATDSYGLVEYADIRIDINDLDEIPPELFGFYNYVIDENQSETIELGLINSKDNIGVTGYELISKNTFSKTYLKVVNEKLLLDLSTVVDIELIDFETGRNNFTWILRAYDAAGNSSEETIIELNIKDVDEDLDGDGILDSEDNCPNIFNPNQLDTDKDGIGDVCDTDKDNDGLYDVEEYKNGTNPLEPDSDGDGSDDYIEGTLDNDGDGIIDALESDKIDDDDDGVMNEYDVKNDDPHSDSDGDGYHDLEETEDMNRTGRPDMVHPLDSTKYPPLDNDKDFSCNWHDQDDDNDEKLDSEEGTFDKDGDGIIDAFESDKIDDDDDGVMNEYDVKNDDPHSDSDGDGYHDLEETEDMNRTGRPDMVHPLDSTKYPPLDNDKDFSCNWHDQDDDNDEKLDSEEGTFDKDGDGIIDAFESDKIDDDDDGVMNEYDVKNDDPHSDSDGDGYHDLEETEDMNRTGRPDMVHPLDSTKYPPLDNDKDFSCNWHDQDDDNDEKLDSEEGTFDKDGDGIIDAFESDKIDDDDDGVMNEYDVKNDDPHSDSDGDGYHDLEETEDMNRTGRPDMVHPLDSTKYPPLDNDKDFSCNWHDQDDDNDEKLDSEEGTFDKDGDGIIDAFESDKIDDDDDGVMNEYDVKNDDPHSDSDGDGYHDLEETEDMNRTGRPDMVHPLDSTKYPPLDNDKDFSCNWHDQDDDNDEKLDSEEGTFDKDGDGIIDAFESDKIDDDDDGVMNEYDVKNDDPHSDSDGDGQTDINETLCESDPLDPYSMALDTDNDNIPNCIDDDIDGDGVMNQDDAFPLDVFESLDTDGDGIGNNIDADDDNDGVLDGFDAFPLDYNESEDVDKDGIADNQDNDLFNDGFDDSRLEVSGLLTPNVIGVESTWKITNINLHPFNKVTVYNVNRNEVFVKVNYQNDWNGSYKDTGKFLPSGSYYYKIHLYDTGQVLSGWLLIVY